MVNGERLKSEKLTATGDAELKWSGQFFQGKLVHCKDVDTRNHSNKPHRRVPARLPFNMAKY
jgi:hypothetical protein